MTVVITITACGRVKSYFPDKEKDYQLATEIPPLQIPEDLQSSAVKNAPLVTEPIYRPQSVYRPAAQAPEEKSKNHHVPVELVDYDGGASRLRIEEPMPRAWRFVGKALSHHSIEIISRDEPGALYVVQYDPDAKKVEDGSIWDEIVFLFGEDPTQEKIYKIRLAEKNDLLTEVVVLDSEDRPLSQGNALRLLNLLKNSINQDLINRQQ